MEDIKINKDSSENTPRVDLSSVEEVILQNGKKYIKYFDLKENKPVMLKNSDSNKSAREQIENLQNHSQNYNSQDALFNTNGILDMEKKYTKEEIILVPIDQIDKYQYLLNNMTPEQNKALNIFIKNKDNFNPKLKYINLDECLAIDEENKVITCLYNKNTNQFDVRYANVVKYEKEEKVVSNNIEANIDNINFEAIIDTIEVNNQPIEVEGYMVDINTLEQYNNYPEVLERKEMAPKERNIWMRLLDIYRKRKQKQIVNADTPKVKTLKTNKKAGFANQLLTVSLAGFTIGIVVSALFVIIKNMFF